MQVILCLGTSTEVTANNLLETYGSIEIDHMYMYLEQMCMGLSGIPVTVDKVLIHEDALGDDPSNTLLGLQTLIDGKFFLAKEILFLLKVDSPVIEYINFIFKDYPNVFPKFSPVYNFQMITELLGGRDALKQNKVELEYAEVVRKKVGSSNSVTLTANSEDGKASLVVDDIDSINNLFLKLEAQAHVVAINNKFVSTEAIQPKIGEIDKVDGVPEQFLPEIEEKKEATKNVLVVSGEKGSGKTSFAYALGKSYGLNKRTLLIDLNISNLGLSSVIEQMKDNITVVFLHDLLNKGGKDDVGNTKAIISKLLNSTTNLNALTLSMETKELVRNEEVLASIVEIILAKLKRHFEIIIIDLPLSKYNQYSFIFNNCNYLLLTFYRNMSSIVSLSTFLAESGLHNEWYKLVFVPTDPYRDIAGLDTSSVADLKETASFFMGENRVAMTRTIQLSSFNQGPELSEAVSSVLTSLPSQDKITEYLKSMKKPSVIEEAKEIVETYVNPFAPITQDEELDESELTDLEQLFEDEEQEELLEILELEEE